MSVLSTDRSSGPVGSRRRPRIVVAIAALSCLTLALSACSSSGGSKKSAASSAASAASSAVSSGASVASSAASATIPKGSGPVTVLYAGSLVDLMQKQIGPGYKSTTGYTLNGYSAGSTALVTQIKGKVHAADVFISASPTANAGLQGAANGNWVSWYAAYASSALVIGFNPKSKFAADLKTKPWYQVITEPGFRLGRTDPKTDPKGKLAQQALTDTASKQHLPALTKIANSSSGIFPEETLVGRLQAGQLDAGFFYTSEAKAANIQTVPVTGESLKATYTVSVVNRAPHEQGAEAFVAYLLGPSGLAALNADGYTLISPPKLTGTGVPASLKSVIPGS